MKRSTTKVSYAEQLRGRVFFVDRSSGRYSLVDGLRKLGLNVEAHDDHFAPETRDIDWISHCGLQDWIVISSDMAIKRNFLEQQAILSSKVAAFFFTSRSISSAEQISAFTAALRRISNLVLNQEKPFIARVSPDGSVELWLDHRGKDLIARKLERERSRKLSRISGTEDT